MSGASNTVSASLVFVVYYRRGYASFYWYFTEFFATVLTFPTEALCYGRLALTGDVFLAVTWFSEVCFRCPAMIADDETLSVSLRPLGYITVSSELCFRRLVTATDDETLSVFLRLGGVGCSWFK